MKAWLLCLVSLVPVAGLCEGPQVLAPGYSPLSYEPPAPGSYALPAVGLAADGQVLDARGRPQSLHALFADRIVVLSFIYSTCSDVNGCPLATGVLHRLRAAMARDPVVVANTRLISLSFDPEHDTPEVIRRYCRGFEMDAEQGDWLFVTTASEAKLRPILEAYDQVVRKEYDERGEPTGTFSHILRVFLIDRRRRLRNIYSVSFLHADTLLNDVRTLLLEERDRAVPVSGGAGDYKEGYERGDYETRSRSLAARKGEAADLVALLRAPPLGLPEVPVPAENPVTTRKVALGRKLFYDRRLSLNDTFSCAMCHIPEQGFSSNELATAVGVEGRTVRRNAPTLYNVAYAERLFHDGREDRLEQQVWAPLLARNEMGNVSIGSVIHKIEAMPDYAGLFEAAFDGRGPTMETLGMAIASYERTLVSGNSPFDRWRYGGEAAALADDARRGFALFTGKAGCSACHRIGENSARFTDNRLHNTGIGYRASMQAAPDRRRVLLAPGVYVEVDAEVIDSVGERPPGDLGLYELTQDPADRWKYKTPTLRNVALTAPYMHDGSLSTLREVVEFYNRGGVANELLDPQVRPLELSEQEVEALVAFLLSLTGDSVDLLVSDAFAAPVGDLTRADPNWAHGNRPAY